MSRNEFFPALPVVRINARLTSASLEICPDDIDDVHVMASGDAPDALQISFSAGTLHITQRRTTAARHPGGWTQLTLRVPRAWKGSIDARTRSGRPGNAVRQLLHRMREGGTRRRPLLLLLRQSPAAQGAYLPRLRQGQPRRGQILRLLRQ